METITISCGDCSMQGTAACDDCVVSFICGRQPDDAVIIDADEERAVRLLARAGLVPRLRHQRRTS
jgi:dihydroxyacid dehydratase/phosphogluconate dehydratase